MTFKDAAGYLDAGYFNSVNTLKSSIGFIYSQLERALPKKLKSSALDSIFNYLPISQKLTTAGQPNEQQLASVKRAGFDLVINLAPQNVENALKDERGLVTQLGMTYIHIPVDFKNPTEENYREFCKTLNDAKDAKIFLHCAANMRVSAFYFRYRTQVLHESTLTAKKDLAKIWEPFGVWSEFIAR